MGLNHTTAPIEVRERLAFNPERATAALVAIKRRFPQCEAMLLSTCNRTEIYMAPTVHAHPRAEDLIALLSELQSVPADDFRRHLYEKADHAAIDHLFAVACSLDSMVLGETQILGQVRQAYELAASAGMTGPVLNPLLQRAIAVGKQVMSTTALSEGRTSVSGVAVACARQVFDHFGDKTVLCIGAGKMVTLALQNFATLQPGRLLICNRSPEKAAALATRFSGAQAVPIERLTDHLVAADIVLSSTGSDRPIITRQLFESLLRQRRYRPIFLIDIALPRDIEPTVGEIENVYLYNLDDLQKVVQSTHTGRRDTVDTARRIVARHVDEYLAGQRARDVGPLIDKLYKRYHQVAAEELERTLAKLPSISDSERAHLQDLTRRIVNKLLHDPVQALRQGGDEHGAPNQYPHALQKLYRITDDTGADRDEVGP